MDVKKAETEFILRRLGAAGEGMPDIKGVWTATFAFDLKHQLYSMERRGLVEIDRDTFGTNVPTAKLTDEGREALSRI